MFIDEHKNVKQVEICFHYLPIVLGFTLFIITKKDIDTAVSLKLIFKISYFERDSL